MLRTIRGPRPDQVSPIWKLRLHTLEIKAIANVATAFTKCSENSESSISHKVCGYLDGERSFRSHWEDRLEFDDGCVSAQIE